MLKVPCKTNFPLFHKKSTNFTKSQMFYPELKIVVIADVTIEYPPLQVVFIFFDTATYDEIERDVKVTFLRNIIELWVMDTNIICEGDHWGSAWLDRGNDGFADWLLHSQRGWDCLLSNQAHCIPSSVQRMRIISDSLSECLNSVFVSVLSGNGKFSCVKCWPNVRNRYMTE